MIKKTFRKSINRQVLTHFDYIVLIIIIPMIYISNKLVGEIEPILAEKQLVYIGISLFIFIILFLYPFRKLVWLIPIFYWLNIILLSFVKFFGISKLGATRWLEIPFLNSSFQPSELIKPALILMLAYIINKEKPQKGGYGIKKFLYLSIYILIPFGLIVLQPDLGTALTLLFIGYGIIFLCGINWKIIAFIVIAITLFITFGYNSILHDYQKRRVTQFLNKKPSYQVQQSIIAIGSGGLFGKSKEDATQTQMRFLPIASSDFIFAYFIERFGFVGGIILIMLYIILILHLFSYNFIIKEDYFIKVIAVALSLLIFIYMSINILMTVGLAPVVGIPLPMISYGGSSFITFVILFTILENLLIFRYKFMYASKK